MAATELTLSDEEQTSLTVIAQQTGKTEAEVSYPIVNDWACPWRYEPEGSYPRRSAY